MGMTTNSNVSGGHFVSVWLFLLLPAVHLAAEEEFAPRAPARYGERPKNGDRVGEIDKAHRAKYKDRADVLVLPGLIARRDRRRVEIMAEATGLGDKTIVEFLLIDQSSGKGYESLFWSFARPSDVHKALVFIGVKPGKPFRPARLRFWPKGERVLASVAPGGSDEKSAPVRLESLVKDRTTGKPLPEAGFVFAGSFTADGCTTAFQGRRKRRIDGLGRPSYTISGHALSEKSGRVYAADVYDPKSVASLYNDPIAVLDVPRRADKGEVYGTRLVGPGYDFAKNELVTIVLEPEHKDGRRRVKDLVLEVRRAAATLEFLLTDATGKAMTEKPELPAVLAAFAELAGQGRDPYVSVCFDGALSLAEVRKVCRVLAVIDSESGIRVEPPAPGQLYYRALLPDRELLDREKRIIEPWELRLVRSSDGLSAVLARHESVWAGTESKWKVSTHDVDSAQSLRKQLDADAERRKKAGRRPAPPVLLVFANANLAYAQLTEFLSKAMATHNIIHVFLEAKEQP